MPQPIRKVKESSSQGDKRPSSASTVSTIETTNMKPCATSMTLRRSKLSAKTPAISEKTMIGNVTEVWTRATMLSDDVSSVIIHAAPTACTSPPKLDASEANQSMANVWFLKRPIRDPGFGIWFSCSARQFGPRSFYARLAESTEEFVP